MRLWLGVVLSCLLMMACKTAPAPVEEYALARAAIEAARSVEAARYSPGFWHQADEAYRQALSRFKDRDYSESKNLFNKARAAAEKAENSARLIRQKNGEVL